MQRQEIGYVCIKGHFFFSNRNVERENKTAVAAQAAGQTRPNATPPLGKIQHSEKLLLLLNQYSDLHALQDLESLKFFKYSCF